MAFYSTRVDEDGQETNRTYASRNFTGSVSSQSKSVPTGHAPIVDKNHSYKTVRYVNPAAYIVKASETDNSQESSAHSAQKAENSSSNIVPPLDLNSDESFQSTPDNMISYNKACEVSKIITKPDAFAAWLSAKKKMKYYEIERKKLIQEEKEKEKNEKERIAQEKYKEWLARKRNSTSKKASVTSIDLNKSEISNLNKNKTSEAGAKESTRLIPKEEIEKKFKEWLERKIEKKKLEKLLNKKRLEAENANEKNRQKQAKLLYNQWLETAPIKPKPVPLNRGLFSLKGTISDIYINPDPWQSTTYIDRDSDDENIQSVDYVY